MSPEHRLLPAWGTDTQKNLRASRTFGFSMRISWGPHAKLYIIGAVVGLLLQMLLSGLSEYQKNKTDKCLDEVAEIEDQTWTLEKAREMVSGTRGYYARDYSLNLGWNNVRYIIEASVYQAKILNRTLVLPSFVYARSCMFDTDACAAFLPKVHWTEAVHSAEWSDHPFEEEHIFRVPLESVLDLQRLRAGPRQEQWSDHKPTINWPVLTVAEYLQLHGLDPSIELHNGYWGRVDYQLASGTNVTAYHQAIDAEAEPETTEKRSENMEKPRGPAPSGLRRAIGAVNVHAIATRSESKGSTIYEMFNEEWDTAPLVRVDDLRALRGYNAQDWRWSNRSLVFLGNSTQQNEMSQKLFHALNQTAVENEQVVMEVRQIQQLAESIGYEALELNGHLEEVANAAGWDFLYTFEGRLNQEFIKSIVWPTVQVAPRNQIRGFVNELEGRSEDIVLVSGEIHLERKAGLMRFTSSVAQNAYSTIGLYAMRAPEQYWRIAAQVEFRMRARCGGRMFMAAHIRRGDFIRFGWATDENLETHVKSVRDKLRNGSKILRDIKKEYDERTNNDEVDIEVANYDPPEDADPFYIATDEHSASGIDIINQQGGILIDDLLTPEDRKLCGWEMLYSDLVALVEQIVMSRASYWNAHAMSSLAGGVVNLRVARGADMRTALLD